MKNIQLIRLTSGEEIIADVDLNGIDTETIIMKEAIVLIPAGEGKIGFMPFMPYSKAAESGIEVDLKFVMFMVEPMESLIDQHRQAHSKIEIPNAGGIIS